MRIDLHCHSKYSYDTYLEPEELIEEAIKVNLDGVCFTEHHSLKASKPVERITIPKEFYVFRGLEISTDRGHLLVYGLKDDSWNVWNRNNYLDVFQVLEGVHGLGGICVPAHPFRGWDSFGEDVLRMEGFDAIETHSGRSSEDEKGKAIHAARIMNLPSIGGSDCHTKKQVGKAFTEFTNPVRTMDELIEEIRRENCRGMNP
jgi:predicted metal-dependent phosphoesterase TrpH